MNFECDNNNAGFTQCSEVFSSAGIVCCDHLVRTNSECVTYCNTSLGQASFIDHIFVSRCIIDRMMGQADVKDVKRCKKFKMIYLIKCLAYI